MAEKNNVVVNTTQGYGYTYASLSDIAKQGYDIPLMKTETDSISLKDYVYWRDEETKEWYRGAEIVIPESPKNREGKDKMNSAQLYGAALTYARRYTVLMANCLATDDDKGIDEVKEEIFDEPVNNSRAKELAKEFNKLYTKEEQARILNGLHVLNAEDIGATDLEKYVNFKKYGKNTD